MNMSATKELVYDLCLSRNLSLTWLRPTVRDK